MSLFSLRIFVSFLIVFSWWHASAKFLPDVGGTFSESHVHWSTLPTTHLPIKKDPVAGAGTSALVTAGASSGTSGEGEVSENPLATPFLIATQANPIALFKGIVPYLRSKEVQNLFCTHRITKEGMQQATYPSCKMIEGPIYSLSKTAFWTVDTSVLPPPLYLQVKEWHLILKAPETIKAVSRLSPAQLKSLTTLSISLQKIPRPDLIEDALRALVRNTSLKCLTLLGSNIDVPPSVAMRLPPEITLASAICIAAHGPRLEKLALNCLLFDSRAFAIIGESLDTNTTLQTLDLYSTNLTPEGVASLITPLPDTLPLRMLNLNRTRPGPEGATAVAQFLARNTTLTILDMGDSNITGAGALALAEVLGKNKNTTLEELCLNLIEMPGHYDSTPGSGDARALALARALKQHKGALGDLNLRDNGISEDAQAAFTGTIPFYLYVNFGW